MFRNKLRFLLFVLGVLQFALLIRGAERISPTAWGIARSKQLSKEAAEKQSPNGCPEPECQCDEDLGAIYYKKLVYYLFRKSKPIADDFEGKHLISIHLQITKEDMRALRETDNVRDIDAIVSAVIENSKGGLVMEAKEVLLSWYDQMHYAYLRVLNSQMLMLVLHLCLFLTSVLCMRFLFRINLVAVLVINLFAVSLFFRYLDCNRRLEFDNMQRIKSLTQGPNPCEPTKKLLGLVSYYDAQKCTDYMMSIHGHDRQFCEPVDFVWDFALNLFLKPVAKFMESVGGFVDKTFDKYGLIKGTLITVIVMCGMTYWMRDFLKSFFGIVRVGSTSVAGSRSSADARRSVEREEKPNIVNVHIKLDHRALGDYVQQVKLDEEKSREAICMGLQAEAVTPPGSPVKSEKVAPVIENLSDTFDLINRSEIVEPSDCPGDVPNEQ